MKSNVSKIWMELQQILNYSFVQYAFLNHMCCSDGYYCVKYYYFTVMVCLYRVSDTFRGVRAILIPRLTRNCVCELFTYCSLFFCSKGSSDDCLSMCKVIKCIKNSGFEFCELKKAKKQEKSVQIPGGAYFGNFWQLSFPIYHAYPACILKLSQKLLGVEVFAFQF